MRYLITGAGQIGAQLVQDLSAAGHEPIVLRRRAAPVPGAAMITGDAGDPTTLREAAGGAAAIFHCIHAPYSASAWRRELPTRELAVMDLAAELNIPVVFPESVYAFGIGARELDENSDPAPVSPLGHVRAELLAARAEHPARTASVIASDLVGPTADPKASVITSTIITPASQGRQVWVLGDPDAPHAVTYIPDLTQAMIAAVSWARRGGITLNAPTNEATSQRHLAEAIASDAGHSRPTVRRIPAAAFALCTPFSPTSRELFRQRYLWEQQSALLPGRLSTELGLRPSPWSELLGTVERRG
ncbi:NAD-dependent epimerase/dehydratase family protein [Leucobacter sp. GX24907]